MPPDMKGRSDGLSRKTDRGFEYGDISTSMELSSSRPGQGLISESYTSSSRQSRKIENRPPLHMIPPQLQARVSSLQFHLKLQAQQEQGQQEQDQYQNRSISASTASTPKPEPTSKSESTRTRINAEDETQPTGGFRKIDGVVDEGYGGSPAMVRSSGHTQSQPRSDSNSESDSQDPSSFLLSLLSQDHPLPDKSLSQTTLTKSQSSLSLQSSPLSSPPTKTQTKIKNLSPPPTENTIPIYVFQSGRPKRRVTIENEQRRSGRVQSLRGSQVERLDSGSGSRGIASIREDRGEDKASGLGLGLNGESGGRKPKRVRIRDREKDRARVREARRRKRLVRENKKDDEEKGITSKRDRRRGEGSDGRSGMLEDGFSLDCGKQDQVGKSRLVLSQRTTRSQTRRTDVVEILGNREDPASEGSSSLLSSSSTSPSSSFSAPISYNRTRIKDQKFIEPVYNSGWDMDGITGPEEIEAALIIGGLIRDAKARSVGFVGKESEWGVPIKMDVEESTGNEREGCEVSGQVARRWRTCFQCGVQFLVGEKGSVVHRRLGNKCRSCNVYTGFAPSLKQQASSPTLYKPYVGLEAKYEDSLSTTQRAQLPPIKTSLIEYPMHPASESEVSTILSTDRETESCRPAPTLTEYLASRGSNQVYDNPRALGHYHAHNHEREIDWLAGMNGPITRYAMSEGLAWLPSWIDVANTTWKPRT